MWKLLLNEGENSVRKHVLNL